MELNEKQQKLLENSPKVKVALKLAYDGSNYSGLALQQNKKETIE